MIYEDSGLFCARHRRSRVGTGVGGGVIYLRFFGGTLEDGFRIGSS